jgi:hypothetical protein
MAASSSRSNRKKREHPISVRIASKERKEGECYPPAKAMDFRSSFNITWPADSLIMNPIRTGSNYYERIGNSVNLISIQYRAYVVENDQSSNPVYLRQTIVYDKAPPGTMPGYDEVFRDTDADGIENVDEQSHLNQDNMDRFIILMDKHTFLPTLKITNGQWLTLTAVSPVKETFQFEEEIDLRGLRTVYKGNDPPILAEDFATGAIYLFVASNTTGDVPYTLEVTARLNFSD